MNTFYGPRLKIERAQKHIRNIQALLDTAGGRNHHAVRVQMDANRINWLVLDLYPSALPAETAALIIGDCLHNLRSSLDILWHEVIAECGGTATKYSRFPIRDTRDELITTLNSALKDERIDKGVYEFVLDSIKPYEAGNYTLSALDDLNIRDKHKLIIPVVKLVWISGVCLQDNQEILRLPILHADGSWRVKLPIELSNRELTVSDNGEASANIFFQNGFPLEAEAVIPALDGIAKEVTRVTDAFALFLG